jgi:hypothetical protein
MDAAPASFGPQSGDMGKQGLQQPRDEHERVLHFPLDRIPTLGISVYNTAD